jgi:hypothetical protein
MWASDWLKCIKIKDFQMNLLSKGYVFSVVPFVFLLLISCANSKRLQEVPPINPRSFSINSGIFDEKTGEYSSLFEKRSFEQTEDSCAVVFIGNVELQPGKYYLRLEWENTGKRKIQSESNYYVDRRKAFTVMAGIEFAVLRRFVGDWSVTPYLKKKGQNDWEKISEPMSFNIKGPAGKILLHVLNAESKDFEKSLFDRAKFQKAFRKEISNFNHLFVLKFEEDIDLNMDVEAVIDILKKKIPKKEEVEHWKYCYLSIVPDDSNVRKDIELTVQIIDIPDHPSGADWSQMAYYYSTIGRNKSIDYDVIARKCIKELIERIGR